MKRRPPQSSFTSVPIEPCTRLWRKTWILTVPGLNPPVSSGCFKSTALRLLCGCGTTSQLPTLSIVIRRSYAILSREMCYLWLFQLSSSCQTYTCVKRLKESQARGQACKTRVICSCHGICRPPVHPPMRPSGCRLEFGNPDQLQEMQGRIPNPTRSWQRI